MRVDEALVGVSRLFLDTAPVIYFVERNPAYIDRVNPLFDRLDVDVQAVISPVTFSECLVGALQLGLENLAQAFVEVFQQETVTFVEIDADIARQAARIRASYNLLLLDAFQVATALSSGCEAFLTNDAALKRITELQVLVVGELEA